MLTIFAYLNGGPKQKIQTIDELAQIWTNEKVRVWIDVEQPTEEELKRIDQIVNVDDESLDDCLHGEQHPRLDVFDDHLFLVLYGARGIEEEDRFLPHKLSIFCGKRFLITVHKHPLRSISFFKEKCGRFPKASLGKGVDFLLYSIIDMMVDNYEQVTNSYEDRLEDLEDVSLRADVNSTLLEKVSDVRRDLSHLRRMVTSQRELLLPLAKGEHDFVSAKLGQRFQHVRDHLTRALSRIELLRELLHSIRDNYHSTLSNRMNAIMKHLTLFATFMLPLSFLAGVYGMNVRFWPPPDRQVSFWIVIALMAAVSLTLLIYFRRKKWI